MKTQYRRIELQNRIAEFIIYYGAKDVLSKVRVACAEYSHKTYRYEFPEGVTHWMDLPGPPRDKP